MAGGVYNTYIPYDVERIFTDYKNALLDQFLREERKIDAWAKVATDKINNHATEQKGFLRVYYNARKLFLENRKDESMKTAYTHHHKSDYEKLNMLLESCRNLKYDLEVAFDHEDAPIPFIYCMTKEEFEQKKNSSSNTKKSANTAAETSSVTNKYRDTNAYEESNTGSSSSSAATGRDKTTAQSSRGISDFFGERTMGADVNRNTEKLANDDSVTKCPVCFMIYPYNMDAYKRQQHVNEHLDNNHF